jgi:hypothetical protein
VQRLSVHAGERVCCGVRERDEVPLSCLPAGNENLIPRSTLPRQAKADHMFRTISCVMKEARGAHGASGGGAQGGREEPGRHKLVTKSSKAVPKCQLERDLPLAGTIDSGAPGTQKTRPFVPDEC